MEKKKTDEYTVKVLLPGSFGGYKSFTGLNLTFTGACVVCLDKAQNFPDKWVWLENSNGEVVVKFKFSSDTNTFWKILNHKITEVEF